MQVRLTCWKSARMEMPEKNGQKTKQTNLRIQCAGTTEGLRRQHVPRLSFGQTAIEIQMQQLTAAPFCALYQSEGA